MADVPIVNLPMLPEYDQNDYLIVEDISEGETCKTRISTLIETNSVISINGMQGDVIITPDDLDDSNTNNKFITVDQNIKLDLIRTDLPADYFLNGQGNYIDMSAAGTGDMIKAVYDPDNIHANAFDYNNFINKPGIPTYLNDLSDVDTSGVTSNQSLIFDGAIWKAGDISTSGSDLVTIKDISSNYTITNEDSGTILECNGTSIFITLPDGLNAGVEVVINNVGTGVITLNASSTLNGKGNQLTTQWSSCIVYHKNFNTWRVYGDVE